MEMWFRFLYRADEHFSFLSACAIGRRCIARLIPASQAELVGCEPHLEQLVPGTNASVAYLRVS